MLLLVGLGNPGPKYEKNRHNIGFMAVDEFVRRHSFGPWKARFQGLVSEGTLGGEKVMVLKPTTFMNESGRAVGEAVRFFKLAPSDVYVIYDELDLPAGKLKVKQSGGHGGHNGLRSLDAHIGKDYWRIRLGIGHPGDKAKVHSHVLGDFSKAEWPSMEKLLDAVVDAFPVLPDKGPGDYMTKVALRLKPPANQKRDGDRAKQPEATPQKPKNETAPSVDRASPKTALAQALAKAKAKFGGGDA
ncbi:aminoacyl-tRNA hydrolase [Aestuariispira ectoiniformans]|uniref:aminoacyl-tRNA hydrolase n=1 Tax=Aestuariispira ectoiniformans TaxID=2775080 RepID=UPI00223A7256|nr:aminoacyl-tRNA hydrolase [Aestuariispira ectoiniformans]